MRVGGIEIVNPAPLDMAIGVALCALLATAFIGAIGASSSSFSGAGAMCGGVIGSIFGVRAHKSILHLAAAGVLGIAGAVVGLSLFALY